MRLYRLIPTYEDEMSHELEHGAEALFEELDVRKVSEVLDPKRRSVLAERFWIVRRREPARASRGPSKWFEAEWGETRRVAIPVLVIFAARSFYHANGAGGVTLTETMSGDQHDAAGVREGDVLAGKYRIDRVLGVGGMGVVVAAHHLQLDERVAIKFMRVEALMNRDAVGRFAREARAAVKIKSEHVCRVSDVGTFENGAPYMVMEHLEGSDLSAWLLQRGALPIEQGVDFLLQACEAIAEAHSLGIVHRDLKPANLFVIRRPDGVLSVKVLDFGISKVTGFGSSGADMTQTSAIMGSPLYMSPEQMHASKDVDPRSDIWALGVILYELLGGQLPFVADTMPELVLKVVSKPPNPLRERRAEVPAALEQIISRCLEKERAQRYQSVAELANALLPFGSARARISVDRISGILHGGSHSTSPFVTAIPVGAAVSTPPGATQSNFGHTSRSGSRARTWLIAGAVVAALCAAAVGLALRGRSDSLSAAGALPSQVAAVPQPKVAPELDAAVPAAPTAAALATDVVAPASPPPSAPSAAPPDALPNGASAPGGRKVAAASGRSAHDASAKSPEKSTAATPAPAAVVAAAPAAQAPPPSPPAAAAASKPGAGLFSDRK